MNTSRSEAGKLGAIASKETQKMLFETRVSDYNSTPTTCLFCKSAFPYENRKNKFCNKSCAAKYNNIGVSRNSKIHNTKSCAYCSNIIEGSKSVNKFCDTFCYTKYTEEKTLENFKNGILKEQSAKEVLIKLHGFKCMECGWDKVNPLSNKCPVELEHIDGNSRNNLPDNLKLLCPNCHSLTPTYKALNVGKGRFSRMKRYNEGKSS